MNSIKYVNVHGETTLRSPRRRKRQMAIQGQAIDLLGPFDLVHWHMLFRTGADLEEMICERKPLIPGNHRCK